MRLIACSLVTCLVLGLALVAGGCADKCSDCGKTKAECKAPKAGVIKTVNKVCVMENDDPVDPEVAPVVWRAKEYGLCCEGCRKKWVKLTDAEKDAACARAVELSKNK